MQDFKIAIANCPKEKLVVHGAAHAASAEMEPELYTQTIKNFLAKYLNDQKKLNKDKK